MTLSAQIAHTRLQDELKRGRRTAVDYHNVLKVRSVCVHFVGLFVQDGCECRAWSAQVFCGVELVFFVVVKFEDRRSGNDVDMTRTLYCYVCLYKGIVLIDACRLMCGTMKT